jgi:acetylornithine deacetylase/succinyl-diaminopimelate desuccinylase-like protein
MVGLETLGLEEVREIVERGVGRYVARFGDKTKVIDPQTGARKVERHFDLDRRGSGRFVATVYGSSGHMGSLPQNDAAITKWAYVVRELVGEKRTRGLPLALALQSADCLSRLSFEGAQGFLPTHSMEDIKTRTREAFLRGIRKYLSEGRWPSDAILCEVSFDKLHNDAFAGDPNSETMRRALRTAADVGLRPPDQPVRGWDVSCDARLFAAECPAMPVITFGAGRLEHAHSDQERIHIAELMQSICFTSLFLMRETGAMP